MLAITGYYGAGALGDAMNHRGRMGLRLKTAIKIPSMMTSLGTKPAEVATRRQMQWPMQGHHRGTRLVCQPAVPQHLGTALSQRLK